MIRVGFFSSNVGTVLLLSPNITSHLFSASFDRKVSDNIEKILIRSLHIRYVFYKFFHLNNGKLNISIIALFTAVVIVLVIVPLVVIIYNFIIFIIYLFDTVKVTAIIFFAC